MHCDRSEDPHMVDSSEIFSNNEHNVFPRRASRRSERLDREREREKEIETDIRISFSRRSTAPSRGIVVPAEITRGGCVQRIRSKPEGWFMYRGARYPMI